MPVFRPDPPAKVVVGTGQDGCRSSIQTASIATLLKIVRLTDAVSLLSEQLILDELELGLMKCIKINHPLAPRVFGVLMRNDRMPSNLANLFCKTVIDQVGLEQGQPRRRGP
jgi:DNA-binding transcriptional LysR family regulator